MAGDFALWMDRRGYAPRTIDLYTRTIQRVEDWAEKPLGRCTWKDLRAYAGVLPESYSSRSAVRSAVTCYWRFLEKKDCPAWAVPQPSKPDPNPKAVEPHELAAILDGARRLGPKFLLATALGYYCGLRRHEIARARWDEYDPVGRVLRVVGKGYKESRQLVPAKLAEILAGHPRGESPWMFPGRRGGHIAEATVNLWIKQVAAASGVYRLTPHILRHTYITDIHDHTGDVAVASKLARHADVRTTMTYTRIGPQKLREAVEGLL